MGHDERAIQGGVLRILDAIGENPQREGLKDTPARVARMYGELLGGYDQSPDPLVRAVFAADGYDQMVILRDIEFDSLCEHHMVPFRGHAHVGYLPQDKVLGVSKLARVVDMFAHRLQIQERLTEQIAGFLVEHLAPRGVGVVVEAQHQCMNIRGVRKRDSVMVTSSMQGEFRDDHAVRDEFLRLIGR